MSNKFPLDNQQKTYLSSVEAAVDFISSNLGQPIKLEDAARAGGFSPYHFHRIFSGVTGENPQDYINRLRLEKAASQLVKSPALSITEIAMQCGFSSSSNFARSFKKHFGISPRDYARQNRGKEMPPAWVAFQRSRSRPETQSLPDVTIKQMPALHLAYFACLEGYGLEKIVAVWQKLFAWAGPRGLLDEHSKFVGISFDDPEITPADKCRYYACLDVSPELNSDPLARFFDIPEHLTAVYPFDGKRAEIQPAYQVLYRDWLPQSGFMPADHPCYEITTRMPEYEPVERIYLDICIPVRGIGNF